MSLSRTWYTEANRALDDTSSALKSHTSMWFAFKEFLKGGIAGTAGTSGAPPSSSYWTCAQSSDSVTASAADNLGAATYNSAKWVRAAAGVAHSWFVLQSPASPGLTGGTVYILVSLGTASDQNATIAISKNAFTGGSITSDPTSTNQSTYTTFQTHPNSTTAGKTHFCVDASGNFWFLSSKNGTGYAHFMFMGQTMTETRAIGLDPHPFHIACGYLDSGRGMPSMGSQSMTGRGQSVNAGVAASTLRYVNVTFSGQSLATVLANVDAQDSLVNALPYGHVSDQTSGGIGIRGRIPDFWLVGAQVLPGSGDPSTGTPTRIVMGDSMIPFGVVPTL